jgi:hypothetical protein
MICPNCKKDAGTAKFCPACWALVYLETERPASPGPAPIPENNAILEEPQAMEVPMASVPPPIEPVPVKTVPIPAGAVPVCPNCKGLLANNATFCGKCGTRIGSQTGLSAYRPPPQPQSPAPAKPPATAQTGCLTLLMAMVGAAAVILVCCFALFGG